MIDLNLFLLVIDSLNQRRSCKVQHVSTTTICIFGSGSFFNSSFAIMGMLWSMGANISISVCQGCSLCGLTLDLMFLMVITKDLLVTVLVLSAMLS